MGASPFPLWMDRLEQKYKADVAAWRQSVKEACRKYSPIRTMQIFIMIGEHPHTLLDALKKGELDRDALGRSAARVLRLIFRSKAAEGFMEWSNLEDKRREE